MFYHIEEIETLMDCREAESLIHLYVDAELPNESRPAFEGHLSRCPRCSAACNSEMRFVQLLKEKLVADEVPAGLDERIRKRLDRADRRMKFLQPVFFVPAAVAAALLAAIALWLFTHDAVNPILEDMIRRQETPLPAELVSEDIRELRQWFNGKLSFPVKPPMFHTKGAKLVGGRMTHLRSLDAARIFYEHAGRPVSLFVFDDSRHALPLPEVKSHREREGRFFHKSMSGYNVVVWRNRQVGYGLISDLDPGELATLASTAEDRDED